MQATLLGVCIAIILALVAALVGPHFVDWTQYRATFEREASRLAGMPVRINGPIDVRLLPTPMLTLGQIEAGEDKAAPRIAVRELYAELALGSLVRGEVRAAEMRIVGPQARLALDAGGKVEWPAARIGFDPDQFFVEKIAIEGGKVTLGDAASGAGVTLEGLFFAGDVRSLLGPIKGEGGFFTPDGERYAYRISASRAGDDGAMRVRLGLDPSDRPLTIVAEGALRLDTNSPRFDGTVNVTRPVAVATGSGRGTIATPWRMTSRVKASPASALFEQVEYQYGPDDRPLKLAGTAELRLGKTPRLDSLFSARQADFDRALDLPDPSRRLPFAALKQTIEQFGVAWRPPFPVKLGISLDSVTLAGGTLQGLRGDLGMQADGWEIETLEFRAPGFTQVRLSGRLSTDQGVAFKGPARIDSSDPRALIAWLEGRTETAQPPTGALRAAGDLTIGATEVAAERLRVEFDRKTIEGRLAYAHASAGRAARLEAELKAPELDVDALLAFGRAALDKASFERPGEVAVTADIGRATFAGVNARSVTGTVKFDPAGVTFDQVKIADLAGAAFNLNGRMQGPLSSPQGSVTFDVDARSLDGTAAVLAMVLPQAAEPLREAAPKITPLKTRATLRFDRAAAGGSTARLSLDGTAGALTVKLATEATGDVATMALPDLKLDAQIGASDGSVLVGLLGLDRYIAVDRRAGTLNATLRGAANGELRVDTRITAGGLNASANGTARLFAPGGFATAVDLSLQGDAAPLRRGWTSPVPVALRAKMAVNAEQVAVDGLTGTVAGSPIRGNLKIARTDRPRVDGRIDAETVDAAGLIAAAIGMPPRRADGALWPAEPFSEGLFGELDGRVEFTAARAAFTPSIVARQVRGVVRLSDGEIAIDDLEGSLATGRANGHLTVRRGPLGLAAEIRTTIVNADASALLPGEGRPAVNGRLGLQVEMKGAGLSPAALMGGLAGSGAFTLEDAALASLDPRAFGAALRSADQAAALDAAKIRDVVTTVLDGGNLAVPRLDAALTITAGQARVGYTIVPGQGADLSFSGGVDLVDGTLDARLTLTGPTVSDGGTATRPDIAVSLRGPVAAPKRTLDVATLSGWLMLRSVERQARRIEAIEAERRTEPEPPRQDQPVAAPPPAAPPVSAALPAPIAIDEAPPAIMQPPRAARPAPVPRPHAPPPPVVDRAPALPPPLEISPSPGNRTNRLPRPNGAALPPPAPRSAFDSILGPLR